MNWWRGIGAVLLFWTFILGLIYGPWATVIVLTAVAALVFSAFIFMLAAGG